MSEKKHPSFGVISWSRITGRKDNLFMSSISHDEYVEIEISEADQTRNLHETRCFPTGAPVIRVAMSELQFAQFLTTSNRGSGIPCTITRLGNKAVEECPVDDQLLLFKEELHHDAKQVTSSMRDVVKHIDDLLRSSVTPKKKDLADISAQLHQIMTDVESNMPFLIEQFENHMNSMFHDAAAQIEGHLRQKLEEIGLDSIDSIKNKSLL